MSAAGEGGGVGATLGCGGGGVVCFGVGGATGGGGVICFGFGVGGGGVGVGVDASGVDEAATVLFIVVEAAAPA